ncbi:MAG: YezD family protein [Opitutaceae bacterium]|jgi:hypothetical protein
MNPNESSSGSLDSPPEWLHIVVDKVASLHYGVVQIVVHDRKVTQIERTEKIRLDLSKGDLVLYREHI